MEQKMACLRGYLEVVGGVLLKGRLLKRFEKGTKGRSRHWNAERTGHRWRMGGRHFA